MVETQIHRPYRWGLFHGWALIVVGTVILATITSIVIWPLNSFANNFFSSYPAILANLRQEAEGPNYSDLLRTYTGWFFMTIPLGFGILKKDYATFLLIVLPLFRSVMMFNVVGIIGWACCLVYYTKRRLEFSWT